MPTQSIVTIRCPRCPAASFRFSQHAGLIPNCANAKAPPIPEFVACRPFIPCRTGPDNLSPFLYQVACAICRNSVREAFSLQKPQSIGRANTKLMPGHATISGAPAAGRWHRASRQAACRLRRPPGPIRVDELAAIAIEAAASQHPCFGSCDRNRMAAVNAVGRSGGVAEWLKATVLKTVGRKSRGFESHPLRHVRAVTLIPRSSRGFWCHHPRCCKQTGPMPRDTAAVGRQVASSGMGPALPLAS